MASGTIYKTVPAVVVAAGIYFFDINHYRPKVTEPLSAFFLHPVTTTLIFVGIF